MFHIGLKPCCVFFTKFMKVVWFDLKEFCKSYEANKKNRKGKRRKKKNI
jgi:hypothetical protein